MKFFSGANLWKFLPVIGLAALTFAGCGSTSSTASTASLRVVNASPNAPGIDFQANGQGFVPNVLFTSSSPYTFVSPTSQKISVYSTGTEQLLPPLFGPIDVATPANSAKTVYAINNFSTMAPLVTTDTLTPPPSGEANLRILHLAPDMTLLSANALVDVYITSAGFDLTTLTPPIVADNLNVFLVAKGVPYAGDDAVHGVTGYIQLAASASGTKYEVQIFPAGTIKTPFNAAIDSLLVLKSTQIRTLLAVDKAFPTSGAPTLFFQAVVLNDLN